MLRRHHLLMLIVCTLLGAGCTLSGTTAPTVREVQAQPSFFFTECTEPLIASTFDAKFAQEDPSNGVRPDLTQLADGTAQVEQSGVYSSTLAECSRMMGKLCSQLKKEAKEDQCTLGEEKLDGETPPGFFGFFWFDYSIDNHSGRVQVAVLLLDTPTAKDKPVRYKVQMTVTEKIALEETPAAK